MNDSLAYVLLKAPIVFGKMALKIAAIVKDASHLNHAIVATAIEKEMSRLLHASAAYRKEVGGVLVRRALESALANVKETRTH